MKLLTLILPCYNETTRLKNNLENLKNLCNIKDLGVIVVDDGSSDSSVQILQTLDEYKNGLLRIYNLNQRSGKAEAVRTGLLLASQTQSEYIGFYDIDFATSPHELQQIINFIRFNKVNVLLGHRPLMNRSWNRISQSAAFKLFIKLFVTKIAKDPQCGLKIFRNQANIKSLFEEKFLCRILFDFELITRSFKFFSGKKITNYTLTSWRDVPHSTFRYHVLPYVIDDLSKVIIFLLKKNLLQPVRQALKHTA
jgi:glycosyltransferase involved in cell wall biosynthesis